MMRGLRLSLVCYPHIACYFIEMRLPSSATATPNIDVWVPSRKTAHLLAKFVRITFFQMAKLTQRNLVHLGCIRTQASYAVEPSARFNGRHELCRV